MEQRTKILLVDDDRDLVHVLRLVLEGRGYAVVAVYDPKEAAPTADRERPDLIVLDVMMPDATEGFHVVWNLRKRQEDYFQHVPIVMLTAIHSKTQLRFYPESSDGTYSAGEYLPVQGFVDKPVEPHALLAEIDRVLGVARRA
jgi:two-component system response regulator MtrA